MLVLRPLTLKDQMLVQMMERKTKKLSYRVQIIQQASQGLSVKEIAAHLEISDTTVRRYIHIVNDGSVLDVLPEGHPLHSFEFGEYDSDEERWCFHCATLKKKFTVNTIGDVMCVGCAYVFKKVIDASQLSICIHCEAGHLRSSMCCSPMCASIVSV